MNRRDFLRSAMPLAAVPFFSNQIWATPTEPSLATHALLKASEAVDRTLVVVQLSGGNDGLNMVLGLDQYTNLANARSNILIPEANVLSLTGTNTTGLHPSMTMMQNMFNDGKLKIVQGVGYPGQSFSHFRSTDIWMSAANSAEVIDSGWLGRFLNTEHPDYPIGYPSLAYPDPLAISISSSLPTGIQGLSANMGQTVPRTFSGSITQLIPQTYITPAPNNYAGQELEFLRSQQAAANAYAQAIVNAWNAGSNAVAYPATPPAGGGYNPQALGQQLRVIARLIKGGIKTKVFWVSMGGFDTHASQTDATDHKIGVHANLLKELSDAIGTFQSDLEQLGVASKVLGMTFSEFGRRIKSNASGGTDHGAASPLFLFGSSVRPGILGNNPTIASTVSVNDNVAMQYDFRAIYHGILLEWFQLSSTEAGAALINAPQSISVVSQAVLPIELAAFEASPRNQEVLVRWQTASEQNVDYFEIQRSSDGTLYDSLGFVKAKGNSQESLQYEFWDRKLPSRDKSLFYRLKIKDLDGTVRLSHALEVVVTLPTKLSIETYPNPTEGRFYVHLMGELNERHTVEVWIRNILGREVYRQQLNPAEVGEALAFDLSHQPTGAYLLTLTNGNQTLTSKVIRI